MTNQPSDSKIPRINFKMGSFKYKDQDSSFLYAIIGSAKSFYVWEYNRAMNISTSSNYIDNNFNLASELRRTFGIEDKGEFIALIKQILSKNHKARTLAMGLERWRYDSRGFSDRYSHR